MLSLRFFLLRHRCPDTDNTQDDFHHSMPRWLRSHIQPRDESKNTHDEQKPTVDTEQYTDHGKIPPFCGFFHYTISTTLEYRFFFPEMPLFRTPKVLIGVEKEIVVAVFLGSQKIEKILYVLFLHLLLLLGIELVSL